jgi:hypothetical protein
LFGDVPVRVRRLLASFMLFSDVGVSSSGFIRRARFFPLERLAEVAYYLRMDDHPEHTELAPPQEWIDALARSDADIAAGRTVPWSEARARLLATLDELEADPSYLKA